jgi:hypothetical protein
MMKPIWFLTVTVAVFAAVFALTEPVTAQETFGARLRGFEEVPSISTAGQGFFFATLNPAGTALDFALFYLSLQGSVAQAHIHVGNPGVNGGIVLFFCTNLAPPAGVPVPPACPSAAGVNTVTGALTASNVITQTGQGISAGDFAEAIRAMRSGFAYANVHSDQFPGGEIRGQISQ